MENGKEKYVPAINTPPWLDKSMWLVVATPLFFLINTKLGTQFSPVEVVGMILPIVTYIVGTKWKSGMLSAETIRANATPPPTTSQAAADVIAGVK